MARKEITPGKWIPRPLLGDWTEDQRRVAEQFPASRRVCVTAANGVGKTHLAADLAVTFLLDLPAAMLITTAPTQRQVENLLWPQIERRLRAAGLIDPDKETTSSVKWQGGDGDRLIGFATNQPQRMQGFHEKNLFIIVDEASGMTQDLLDAAEGIAVGSRNYILFIGNPNEPQGPFYALSKRPSVTQEQISALTHPNILARSEVIPGATTWTALCDRIQDWCREVDQETDDTFRLEISDADLGLSPSTETRSRIFLPNDAFRVRFLGLFPSQASDSLFNVRALADATSRAVFTEGRTIAALDVARTGGDRTIYSLRRGNAVTDVRLIQPADLMIQAEAVAQLLTRDAPAEITIDASGIGIGLIDYLRRITSVPVKEFNGGGEPVSPLAARRYYNRRALAYANLASAIQRGQCSIPNDPDLLEELGLISYKHKADGRMIIASKDEMKAAGFRSPDKADAVSMLFETGVIMWTGGIAPTGSSGSGPRRRFEEW